MILLPVSPDDLVAVSPHGLVACYAQWPCCLLHPMTLLPVLPSDLVACFTQWSCCPFHPTILLPVSPNHLVACFTQPTCCLFHTTILLPVSPNNLVACFTQWSCCPFYPTILLPVSPNHIFACYTLSVHGANWLPVTEGSSQASTFRFGKNFDCRAPRVFCEEPPSRYHDPITKSNNLQMTPSPNLTTYKWPHHQI